MPLLRNVLALPVMYRAWVRAIGGNARETYVREYLRPEPGERVLDVGCGPGDVLAYLPELTYIGVDLSEKYVAAARNRFGTRGEFRCQDVSELAVQEPASFDLVMANGLLHHLDDATAAHLMDVAARALKPGGRLVTLDGCRVPGQSRFARFMLNMDRGKFVRHEAGYVGLARARFSRVESHVRHDLMRLPYTHIILVCREPRPGQGAAA
jgi:SAM-dependent methyltransferase